MRDSSNPVMRGVVRDNQNPGGYAGFGSNAAGAGQAAMYNQYGQQVPPQYAPPQAVGRQLTIDDVVTKTAITLGVLTVTAILSYVISSYNNALAGPLMGIGAIVGLVLVLVASFGRKQDNPAIVLAYAAFEGLLLGGFSGVMEARYEGIVVQAVLATLATFGAMLAAYSFGGFRVQGRFRRVVVVATFGYMIFSLINFFLMVTGLTTGAWGLRSLTIMGIPLGVPLGILAVILASFFLAIDFESIGNGVRNGLPQRYAWAGAFGLVVTLVWLYVEFLRLLSYFRD